MEKLEKVPLNVPMDRVVDFDIYDFTIRDGDYARTLKRLTAPGLTGLLWSPYKGGNWIVTRAAGIKMILNDHEHFSFATAGRPKPLIDPTPPRKCPFSFKRWFPNKGTVHSGLSSAPLVPLQIVPPDHISV